MTQTLLATKLYIPPTRPALVARPRLIERLNESLHKKLTLISAPPGFGKTTLLSEWIHQNDEYGIMNDGPVHKSIHHSSFIIHHSKFAWLSLDRNDNDPVRFWSYVLAALDSTQPNLVADAQTLLLAPQSPPIEVTLTTLINAIATTSHQLTLVLDDYHIIENENIQQAIEFFIEHLPPQIHLILTSRADPPLPLTRLRVQNQLIELRDNDLRFTLTETVTFLNSVMRLNLSPDDIVALENRTEGWAAGLQLAALSMQGQQDTSAFVQAFTGSHHYIIDYLAEEVLARQPEAIRAFLLKTSILERLCGPLCATIVEDLEIRDWRLGDGSKPENFNLQSPISTYSAQTMLEHLEQNNLFLIPLDGERRWYRYHHLFADFLREHLRQVVDNNGLKKLHQRAANWYAANGYTTETIRHALAADNIEQAARLVEQVIIDMLAVGEVTTATSWLDALPQELIHTRPRLTLGKAWAMVIFNQWDKVVTLAEEAEKGLARLADRHDEIIVGMRGELAALQAMLMSNQGEFRQAIELCRQALDQLPADNLMGRSIIMMTMGGSYAAANELDKASEVMTQALTLSRQINAITIALPVYGNLGQFQEEQGRLHQAAHYYEEAVHYVEERAKKQGAPTQPPLIARWTYLNIAEIQREWNDLEAAQRNLTLGLQPSPSLNAMGNTIAIGNIILARVLQAQGDEAGAMEAIEQAIRAANTPYSSIRLWAQAVRARLWLAQGNVEAALSWANRCGLPLDKNSNFTQYPGEYTTLARIYIASEQFDEALNLLKRMYTAAKEAGRTGRAGEIVMLQALALHAQGNTEQALAPLTQALVLGEPGEYIRLFVDEGVPMAQLLCMVKSRNIAPNKAYLDKLLAAFSHSSSLSDPIQNPLNSLGQAKSRRYSKGDKIPWPSFQSQGRQNLLIDPLSERELEVLRLVAGGLSNREIAEQLVITVGTAKTHTINIYRKLDVNSRTQAIARATELGLL